MDRPLATQVDSLAVAERVRDDVILEELGTLEVVASKPFLTIGIHRLEGKFVDLKKPLVVLDPAPGDGATFTVAGVVRRKALFKLRPKVLIKKNPDAA